MGLMWFSPTAEAPFYSGKPLGNCNMVMAQILRLFKWTQDQISQLACACNNTENSPRHSEPFTIKLIPPLHFALYPHFTDSLARLHVSP